jgi:CHAT domain-containing protein
MIRLRYISLLLLFIFITTAVSAQEGKTEKKEARFRINSVQNRNDSLLVMVSGGKQLGLQPGLFIKCFSAFRDVDGVEQSSREIGYGTVTESSSDQAVCVIILYNDQQLVEPGDHIGLNVNLPALSYPSLLYDISLNGIQFVNVDKTPFFNFNEFMASVSKSSEEAVKKAMVEDLHLTYEKVKDRTNLPASMFSTMKAGRYMGKNAMEVLKEATISDLNGFLIYVKKYPAKYVGNIFRLSESFTGWVVSNSPYTAEEVQQALMPWYKNKTEFFKRIQGYSASILAEGHCTSFGEDAVELVENKKITEADNLMQFAFAVAEAIKDTAGKASLLLSKAQIYLDQEKYKEAIAECDKVVAVATLCKDSKNKIFGDCRKFELAAIIKKGFCQYKMSLYKEGLSNLAEAESRSKKYAPYLSFEDHYFYQQRIFEFSGWINYTSGDYIKAISNFGKAIRINDSINTYASKNKNADYYKRIGNVYKEQGNYSQALEFYKSAADIYKGLSDRVNELYVQVDIGEAYYYLSDYDKSIEFLEEAKQGLLLLEDYNYAGYASSLTGSAYYMKQKYYSAIISHGSALELRKKANSISGQGFSWNKLGELFLLSGQKNEALAAYDSSIKYYSAIPDKAAIAGNYNSIGEVYLKDENFRKAAAYFEKAKGNTSKTTVEALCNLSYAWMPVDTVKAKNYLLQCKKISGETGNDMYKFYSLIELSKLAYRNNNFKEADNYYDSVAAMARSFNNGRTEAMRLDLKAYSYTYRLEVDNAIADYRQSVAIWDTVDLNSAVWERISLGYALISKGEFKEAENVLLNGIRVADTIKAMLALGSSYTTGSFLYALLGEFDKGMKANEKASAIYSQTGNNFRQADALMTKGTLYKTAGEFKKSIEALLAADSIYKAEGTEEFRLNVLNNIGVTYYNQGNYTKAIDYFNQSAKYFKAGLIDETWLLNKENIADCYYYLGKNKEAEKILLNVYPLAKGKNVNRIASSMALTLGKVYFDDKQFAKAAQYLDTARVISARSSEKEKMVDALVSLAKVKSTTGNDADAEKWLQEAIQVGKEYNIPSFSWIAYYESGLLFYRQKKYDKAITDFKNAVEIIEKNSSNVYGSEDDRKIYRNDPRKVDLYGKLVVALVEAERTQEAWAYANRSNMAGIKELMGKMTDKTGDPAKDAALEEARSLSQKTEILAKKEAELKAQTQTEQVRSQLQSIGQEKEIAGAQYLKYTEALIAKYPDLKENFYDNVNPADFEKYKRKLKPDMAVLLYVANENKLLIFSLTREKLAITPVDIKENISLLTRQYAALLKTPGKATGTGAINVRTTIAGEEDNIDVSKLSFTSVSEKLYDLVIAPVSANISDKKKLCIVVNGDLSNIPFQAIGHKLPDSSFRFLVEDKMVFYTNRMMIFDEVAPDTSDMSSFAVFGVPDKTLRYTEKEARSIGSIMHAPDGIYVANDATEQQAKLSLTQKKYIHFATHGILNYTDYNASYLKFLAAKDTAEGNNGKLTIDEIYGLDIEDCELVTLSACETAVSREKTKGWKISPANSLLRKSVKSVIASLWKVDDEATSILMDEFYRQLSNHKEKGEALRLAQETLSKDPRYSHPYFWSAFVLYGDWR